MSYKYTIAFITICIPYFLGAQSLGFSSQVLENNTTTNGAYCNKKIPIEYKKIPRYTIQLTSTKSFDMARKNIRNLPKKYKKDTKFYKVGCYFTARFGKKATPEELKPYVEAFHKLGFKDAYILKSTQWHMLKNYLQDALPTQQKQHATPKHKKPIQQEKKHTSHTPKPQISHYVHSNMVLKADEAYKKGDESTAMIYYEMLLNSGDTNPKIKNNLCYLYGKRGAWFEAKDIIDKEKYPSKLIYAYAYGALESNQKDFIQNLSQEILFDKSGRLALLAGYYYEQKEDMDRALVYYKMAYEKNPSNLYNLYAYARALDIEQKTYTAIKYYKKTLQKLKKSDKNYNLVYNRIQKLKEM